MTQMTSSNDGNMLFKTFREQAEKIVREGHLWNDSYGNDKEHLKALIEQALVAAYVAGRAEVLPSFEELAKAWRDRYQYRDNIEPQRGVAWAYDWLKANTRPNEPKEQAVSERNTLVLTQDGNGPEYNLRPQAPSVSDRRLNLTALEYAATHTDDSALHVLMAGVVQQAYFDGWRAREANQREDLCPDIDNTRTSHDVSELVATLKACADLICLEDCGGFEPHQPNCEMVSNALAKYRAVP